MPPFEAQDWMKGREADAYLEEYKSIRAEAQIAQQSQHTTMQWTLAAFALVFAGGLTVWSRGIDGVTGAAALIVFLLILPGGVVGGTLMFFGELWVMVRAGKYIRHRERLSWTRQGALDEMPLAWQTSIRMGELGIGRRVERYLGPLSIYLGGLIGALVIGSILAHSLAAKQHEPWLRWVAPTWSAVFFIAYALLLSFEVRAIFRSDRDLVPTPQVSRNPAPDPLTLDRQQ